MKRALLLVLIVGSPVLAEDAPTDAPASGRTGFGFLTGYKSIPVKRSFAHDTHPGDSFLPGAGIPGSAGTTSIDRAQFFELGFRFEAPLSSNWHINIDAGGLVAVTLGNGDTSLGMNLDDRQNINDNRAPANAAFVYTDARWGFDVALGINYNLSSSVYIGGVVDLAGVLIDHGWDRFSSYSSQKSELVLVPAAGPKLGVRLTENTALEGIALLGQDGVGFSAGVVFRF